MKSTCTFVSSFEIKLQLSSFMQERQTCIVWKRSINFSKVLGCVFLISCWLVQLRWKFSERFCRKVFSIKSGPITGTSPSKFSMQVASSAGFQSLLWIFMHLTPNWMIPKFLKRIYIWQYYWSDRGCSNYSQNCLCNNHKPVIYIYTRDIGEFLLLCSFIASSSTYCNLQNFYGRQHISALPLS